jgi:hypothetical protein
MPPKFNRLRAVFVLGKIDGLTRFWAWEQRKETERDIKFVELAFSAKGGRDSTGGWTV